MRERGGYLERGFLLLEPEEALYCGGPSMSLEAVGLYPEWNGKSLEDLALRCALLLSRVQLLCDPMDCSLPGFSVHGDWILQARTLSGLPHPSLGDLPNPGIKPRSPALQADSLPSELPGS